MGAHASAASGRDRKMVVVVANRLVLADVTDPSLPSLSKVFTSGASALISPNCSRPRSENAVLATASAGATCWANGSLDCFFDADELLPVTGELASDAFAVRTGRAAKPGSALFLSMGPTERAAAKTTNNAKLGALGESLHAAGKRTCVIGCADASPETPNRAVTALAMDHQGAIDRGMLGPKWGLADPSSCGLLSDPARLLTAVERSLADTDLVVVNFGDTARIDDLKLTMSDAACAAHKRQAMKRMDALVGGLLEVQAKNPDVVIAVVSFSPPQGGFWNLLTPISVYSGKGGSGYLASRTTRTPGLIAASDFAPTVLSHLGVAPVAGVVGRAASPLLGVRVDLADMEARVKANHTLILPVLASVAGVGAVCLTLAAVLLAFSRPISSKLSIVLRAGMLVCASACLAMLLAVLAPAGELFSTLATVICALAVAAIALLIGEKHCGAGFAAPVIWVFVATAIAVVIDALTGGNLCKFALPSSFQLDGFRYYGIGNEYAGVLMAMSAAAVMFSRASARKWLAPVVGVLVVAVLGLGRLGANYGGTAAAVVTFTMVCIGLNRGRFGARHVFGALAVAFVVVCGLAFIDWRMAGAGATHAGRVTDVMHRLGDGYVIPIVLRKVLLNLGITTSDVAVKVYLAFVPFLALWVYGLQSKITAMLGRDPRLVAALKGMLYGALAAFLLNDSGVVMANIMIAMIVLVLLYSLLENQGRNATVGSPEG